MSRLAIKRFLLVLAPAMLAYFGASRAFELVELQLDITIQEEDFGYSFQGTAHTGFSIVNPDLASLELQSTLLPQLGLLENEFVQDGFVLFDGTLWLQVTDLDEAGGRADIRTTYRMDVAPRMLRRDFLRARFVRQLEIDEGRARVRARAASLADIRMMRFVEEDARWVRASLRAPEGRARFIPRMEPDGRIGHYGYFTAEEGGSYVWTVLDRNSRYAVGLTVDRDNDGIVNVDDNCLGTALGAIVNADGCSIAQLCPCDNEWRNHGAYVRCTAQTANEFLAAALVTVEEKDEAVAAAAESACGARH